MRMTLQGWNYFPYLAFDGWMELRNELEIYYEWKASLTEGPL